MRKLIYGVVLCLTVVASSAAADGPDQTTMADKPVEKNFRLALGLGIPYGGGIGGNLEAMIGRHFAASAGAGLLEQGEFGWSFGARVYPLGNDLKFNPRLSAYYGTVALLNDRGTILTDTGGAYGIGFEYKTYPNFCIDVDLLYLDYNPSPNFIMERSSSIKLAIGYGWHF